MAMVNYEQTAMVELMVAPKVDKDGMAVGVVAVFVVLPHHHCHWVFQLANSWVFYCQFVVIVVALVVAAAVVAVAIVDNMASYYL
jgi:hypothetical protein